MAGFFYICIADNNLSVHANIIRDELVIKQPKGKSHAKY